MSVPGLLQVALYVVILFLHHQAGWTPFVARLQRPAHLPGSRTGANGALVYPLTGVNPEIEQGWKGYAFALVVFSVVGGT